MQYVTTSLFESSVTMKLSTKTIGLTAVLFLFIFYGAAGCDDGEFECRSSCMPNSQVCNGVVDCSDGTDELSCKGVCKGESAPCRNGRCALSRYDCSGFDKCGDGSRNENCTVCRFGGHLCGNGRCVRLEQWYPSSPNDICEDGSNIRGAGLCQYDSFKCADGECTRSSNICDGTDDCEDGSDERVNCLGACTGNAGVCKNGNCVRPGFACSGFDACGDGGALDSGCTTCNYGATLCPGGRCVRPEIGCDGTPPQSNCTAS